MPEWERKTALRKKYLKQRDEFFCSDMEKHRKAGQAVKKKALAMKRVKTAGTVFLYASCKSEMPTKELLMALLLEGKQVAFPKVNGERMDFYMVSAWEELMPGYHGILEPEPHGREPLLPKETDVMFVPGAVFDKKGGRIGYGGGYYDRYLSELEAFGRKLPYLAGLCYHQQVHKKVLPLEQHDRRMNAVVTERHIYDAEAEPGKFDWVGDVIELIVELVIDFFD